MTTRISEETRARIAAAWHEILADIADGGIVRDVLKAHGVSLNMIRAFRAGTKDAQAEWDTAKTDSADAFSDEGLELARNPAKIIAPGEPGNESGTQPLIIRVDPAFARAHLDFLKWLASKRNPRTYSEKAQLDVNVRTVDLTRIIEAANARIAQARAPRVIEHAAPSMLELAAPGLAELL
jgi:hypothetical protein